MAKTKEKQSGRKISTGFTKLETMLMLMFQSLKVDIEDYCDLETVCNETTFVTKTGAMITLIEYKGIKSLISPDAFANHIARLTQNLMSFFKEKGHSIHMCFRVDHDVPQELYDLNQQQKSSTRKSKLNVESLIDEITDTYADQVFNESCIIALITEKAVLSPIDIQQDNKARKKLLTEVNIPSVVYAQDLLKTSHSLYVYHENFVSQCLNSFSHENFPAIFSVLDVREAARKIKKQLNVYSVSKDFNIDVPTLDSAIRPRWKELPSPDDLSHIFYQPLDEQIMTNAITTGSSKNSFYPVGSVVVDGMVYAPLFVDVPPSKTNSFEALFRLLNQARTYTVDGAIKPIPYAVSFCITGDGMAGKMMKTALASVIHFMSSSNKAILHTGRALNALKNALDQDDTVTGLQIALMTWAENTEQGLSILTTRRQKLWKSFETWGGPKLIEQAGDPILGFTSTIPGLTVKNHAPISPGPLFDQLYMLPLTRINSPYNKGHVPMKTLDGKLILIDTFSLDMNNWCEIHIGRPRTGKSSTQNYKIAMDIMAPGVERLPLTYMVDVGESSRGVIEMVESGLPPELRHLTIYKRMRNSKDDAINPLEFTVGLRRPLEYEIRQMRSFIAALVTPPEAKGQPYPNTIDIITEILNRLFEKMDDTAPASSPKMYTRYTNPELDAILIKRGIIKESAQDTIEISYFMLRDRLHQMGEEHGRNLAHRFAMPLLSDITNILSMPAFADIYKGVMIHNESAINYINQKLLTARTSYPSFFHYTTFDIGHARVAAIDLNEVASISDTKTTSLFFQIVRMFIKRKFAICAEDIPEFPSNYHDYAVKFINDMAEDRKIISYDELHVAGGDPMLMRELDEDARTLPKWNARLNLSSHDISDFGDLAQRATAFSIVDAGTQQTRKILQTVVGLSQLEIDILNSGAIGLNEHGLTFFSRVKLKDRECSALYTLKIPPRFLWALSTQPDERALKKYTYDILGDDRAKALKILAAMFPKGAMHEISSRRRIMQSEINDDKLSDEQLTRSVISTMAREMVKQYLDQEIAVNILKSTQKDAKTRNLEES